MRGMRGFYGGRNKVSSKTRSEYNLAHNHSRTIVRIIEKYYNGNHSDLSIEDFKSKFHYVLRFLKIEDRERLKHYLCVGKDGIIRRRDLTIDDSGIPVTALSGDKYKLWLAKGIK